MNYYKRHIGDYIKDTAHLSLLEHGVYTRLLDVYYGREGPILETEAARLIGARTAAERAVMLSILTEFFDRDGEAWRHGRCDTEIGKLNGTADNSRTNGKSGGRPRKNKTHKEPENNPVGFETKPENNLSHKPVTITQEKDKKENGVAQKSEAETVLDFLNEKTGRRYQPGEANLGFIESRLKEGATVDELIGVIERKSAQWLGDPEMEQYLRPATLFNKTKFAQYQGETNGAGDRPRERRAVV